MIHYKKLIPLVLIAILMIIAYFSGVRDYFTYEQLKTHHNALKTYVAHYPLSTPLAFICVYIISTALSLPGGAFLSLIGGFLFLQPWSTLYVIIGATIGATLLFLTAKSALGELLFRKAGPALKKLEAGFRKNDASYLLFLRFIPLFPFWLVNLAAAFFRVSLPVYLLTTAIGIAPGSFVFTQAGRGLSAILETNQSFSLSTLFNFHVRIALIALAIFSLIPILVKKITKK